jgi:hypothetical protein
MSFPALPFGADADKVQALFRLTASDKDGEALASLRGLQRLLAKHKLSLNDLMIVPVVQPANDPGEAKPQADEEKDWPAYWLAVVADLQRRGARKLAARDVEFLENIRRMCERDRSPSPAQRKWLKDIRQKLAV